MIVTYVIGCASAVDRYTKNDIAVYQLHQENIKHDIVVAIVLKLQLWLVPAQLPNIPQKDISFYQLHQENVKHVIVVAICF